MSEPIESNVLVQALNRAVDMLDSLRTYLLDDEARAAALAEMGLNPSTELPDPEFTRPEGLTPDFTRNDWLNNVAAIVKLSDELLAFIKRAQTDPSEAVADEVFALLTLNYFRLRYPVIYFSAEVAGFLLESFELERLPPTTPEVLRAVGKRFLQFVSDPIDTSVRIGTAARDLPFETEEDARLAADVLFSAASIVPPIMKWTWWQTQHGWDAPASTTPIGDSLAERAFAFRFRIPAAGDVVLLPAVVWQFVPKEHGGPGMLMSFTGSAEQTWEIAESWDAKLRIVSPGQLDVLIPPGWRDPEFFGEGPTADTSQAEVSLTLARRPGTLAPPTLGLNDGVRIEFGDPSFTVRLTTRGLSLSARAARTALIIEGKPDPLTDRTLPQGGWRGNLDLDLTLLPEPAFRGSGGLEAHVPFNEGVGGVQVPYLLIGLRRQPEQKGLTLEVSAAITVQIGPVTLTLDRIGFAFDFKSFRDVDSGFQPPRGVGVAIDAKGYVKGGGFLLFDPDRHEYAGLVELQLSGGVQVKAIGIITTAPELSFLVILTVENIGPYHVGLGFNLIGIGGLVGFDRGVAMADLRAGIANRTLDRIMFPVDPVANAPAIIRTAGTVFPAARGQFIVGVMAQFNWGLGKLLTIEIAFVLELPSPARLIILGKLRLFIPDPERALVRIQVDLIGEIDFSAGRAFVLAKLVDSKLMRFDLKGSAAFYATWGDAQAFILSFGGFNPRFQLEDGLPPEVSALERLTVSLAREQRLELTLSAYLAFTSNTIQIGGSLHAFASAGKFSVDGYLALDALIDRAEGKFFVDIEARLQLKAWGVNLFMVKFTGVLDGPNPLSFRGKATFSIWIFDYSVPVAFSSGQVLDVPAAPLADVQPVLLAALGDPASWNVELPADVQSAVTLKPRPADDRIALHPLGTLSVRQSVVPLGIQIARFGRSRPQGQALFQITGASVRGQAVGTSTVFEHFARSEFFDLSDDEAYGAPSFERMAAGVSIGSAAVTAGPQATVVLDYQTLIYDAETGKMESGDTYPLPDGHLGVLMTLSAAAARVEAYTGPLRPVLVVQPRYVIAAVSDFSAQDVAGLGAAGTGYTAATQALKRHLAENPGLRGALTIAAAEAAA
jgi:hypothetical protein